MEDNIVIYAIMPSYLYKTKELTSEEKLIAERITSLCRKEGYCWITNKTLGDMYGIREDTVSKHIKRLRDYGFIKCVYEKSNQHKSNRIIYLTNDIWDKYNDDSRLNKQEDIGYMKGHNNYYNNKNNYKYNTSDQISYDEDGVMLWNGKRCESIPLTEEEQNEMEELLKEYKS